MNDRYSDEELYKLSNKEKNEYYYALLLRYLKIYPEIVLSVSNRFNFKNIDADDYLLNFYISFEQTIQKYDIRLSSFRTFFGTIMARNFSKEIKRTINSKDALDKSISLNEINELGCERMYMVENDSEISPEIYFNNKEKTLMLCNHNGGSNNDLDQEIMNMRASGFTFQEIAQRLNISYSKVRRTTIRKKNKVLKKLNIRL